MKQLPLWNMPDTFPTVYDLQSGTVIEMVSKVYGAVRDLIAEYNEFAQGVNNEIKDFKGVNTEEIQNFVTGIETRINCKFLELDNALAEYRRDLRRDAADLTEIAETVKAESRTPRLYQNDGGRVPVPAAVSFMDDDCRLEVYTALFPLIQKTGIPYTLACPPANIGKNGYMNAAALLEMYSTGVTISNHTTTEENMDTFDSLEEYEADIVSALRQFREMGIETVPSMSYPQGVFVDEYITAVKKYFRRGFTVQNGVNQIPYESFYMKRVGLFKNDAADDGTESLALAKAYVDQVVQDGGWLVFMTHAWYKGFKPALLEELIQYIQAAGIPIVDVNEMIEKTGNVFEAGKFKKPLADLTEPYFVVDASGKAWAKGMEVNEIPGNYEPVDLVLRKSKVINEDTCVTVNPTDNGYVVSEYVDVTDCAAVILSGWAHNNNDTTQDGYQVYTIKDKNYKVVGHHTAVNTWDQGGDGFDHVEIPMPEGAAMIMVAGYTYRIAPQLTKIKKN